MTIKNIYAVLFAFVLVIPANSLKAAIIEESEPTHWWSGFSITPAIGMRMASMFATRKFDGYSGSIGTFDSSRVFYGLNFGSPEYEFGETGLGVSVQSYSSYVNMNSQWFDYGIEDPEPGEMQGYRVSLGTSMRGTYNYIVPMLHYELRLGRFAFRASAGIGWWAAKFNGDIVLAEDSRPSRFDAKTPFKANISQWAYLTSMTFKFPQGWSLYMNVGGPKWEDSRYRFKLQEVALALVKSFVF